VGVREESEWWELFPERAVSKGTSLTAKTAKGVTEKGEEQCPEKEGAKKKKKHSD